MYLPQQFKTPSSHNIAFAFVRYKLIPAVIYTINLKLNELSTDFLGDQ